MREILYELLALGAKSLGFAGAERLGQGLGAAMWAALPKRRRLASEAVAFHLGLPPERAAQVARSSFGHSARSFAEICLTRRVDWKFMADRATIADPELFEAWRSTDRPMVVATAHLGAWELLVGFAQLCLPGRQRQVVVRRSKDASLNQLMLRLRSRPGVDIVEHRNAAKKVLRCLKQGGTTAFLVDHNCSREEALFLPFLNDVAAVNMGPALLAVRAGALVWPCFLLREEGGRYLFAQEPPLDTAALEGTREDKVRATAQFYTRAVEKYVRACPEQWFWMHRRWKTRPPQGPEAED